MPSAAAIAPLPLEMATQEGMVLGTPRYASPEGATGGKVDARADLYATGLVLYTLLAGRGPFDDVAGQAKLLFAHATRAPAPPSRLAKTPIPPELDRAVLMALAKHPAERFQTAREFRAVIEQTLELLRRPTGWLETTVFELGGSFANSSPLDDSREAASGSRPPREADSAVSTQHAEQELVSPVVDAIAPGSGPGGSVDQLASSRLTETGLSPALIATLFFLAMALAGLAALGLVSAIRGP
jgi:serine/threonine protein kinase